MMKTKATATNEKAYFYAIRIRKGRWPAFLARLNASAPNLFWFHEDAVAYRARLQKCKPSCDCHKCTPERVDIVKVFVRWTINGKTYNTPGDMFRSAEELSLTEPAQSE